MKCLLIGCGNSRDKKLCVVGDEAWRGELITIDIDPNCKPDHVIDMAICSTNMPFGDMEFDEIHAYDTLEHWGAQGDFRQWFAEMREYHRLLKPGGTMHILVPIGDDAFADPGHCRFFSANWFWFLQQSWYDEQIAKAMPVTDYRWLWDKDFRVDYLAAMGNHHLATILRRT